MNFINSTTRSKVTHGRLPCHSSGTQSIVRTKQPIAMLLLSGHADAICYESRCILTKCGKREDGTADENNPLWLPLPTLPLRPSLCPLPPQTHTHTHTGCRPTNTKVQAFGVPLMAMIFFSTTVSTEKKLVGTALLTNARAVQMLSETSLSGFKFFGARKPRLQRNRIYILRSRVSAVSIDPGGVAGKTTLVVLFVS